MPDNDVIAAAKERLEQSGLPSEWLDIPVHWGVKAKEQATPENGGLRFEYLNVDVYGKCRSAGTTTRRFPEAHPRHAHGADGLLDLRESRGLVRPLRRPL